MDTNKSKKQSEAVDGLHEECAIFGMDELDGKDVASTIYYGLFA